MQQFLLALVIVCAVATCAIGQTNDKSVNATKSVAAQVIELWPEGVPGLHADASPEKMVDGRIVNVHRPTLTVYAPARPTTNGTAVIFCPGGGYVRLAVGGSSGPPETSWLGALGVTVFVLRYRLAEYGQPAPLRDVLRAVRVVRARAAEFGVRPDRIGVFGVSAGGHLSACAATMFDAPEGRTGAALDSVSARPDFVALIYPVITMAEPFVHKGSRTALLGNQPSPELIRRYSIEQRVRKDMPPVFIAATMADQSVPVENSLQLYEALRRAGVPAELHIYAQGAHGNSLDPQYGPTAQWPERCVEWMRFNGWLPKVD
ncbi:MAG: alpha/beta hydrolase [Pyrinomonadaceae bacterium]